VTVTALQIVEPRRPAGYAPVLVVCHAADRLDPGDPVLRDVTTLLWRLLHERSGFAAYCLCHQVLCGLLGFELVRRPSPGPDPSCGGSPLVAVSRRRRVRSLQLGAMIEVSADPDTGEVYGLRGPTFRSVAGHPGTTRT
jgi:phenazine biosynthesis protein phzE